MDFATGSVPVAEAWIRQLHAEICSGQSTYTVQTAVGAQESELPLGEYKKHPNHVRTPVGQIHSYAPVNVTSAEMHRFCEDLRSEAFLLASPVMQVAFSHYGLVWIHPFADGNGRVARALASVYSYRAYSIPLLILSEQKREYFATLSLADDGNYQAFVDFILDRLLDSMQLVIDSVQAAKVPDLQETLSRLRTLYVTRGGYTHAEVDHSANLLLELIMKEVNRLSQAHNIANQFQMSAGLSSTDRPYRQKGYRQPLSGGASILSISLMTSQPASASFQKEVCLYVPVDCGKHDDILVVEEAGNNIFRARIGDLIAGPTPSIQIRARIWVESMVGGFVLHLTTLAEAELKKAGYR